MPDFALRSSTRYKTENDTHGRFTSTAGPGYVGLVPNAADWPLLEGNVGPVDSDRHECIVLTDDGRELKHVSWASPMFSCANGGGVYVMPEVGNRVILGHFANGMWYILGFIPMFAEFEGYSTVNGRKPLQQGDVIICASTGVSIEMRKIGEQIILKNGPNFFYMETTANRISMASQRMTVRTDAGLVTMETDDAHNTTTTLFCKRNVGDKENFVKVVIGYLGHELGVPNHGDLPKSAAIDEVVLYIDVCDKFKLSVDTSGNLKIVANSITQESVQRIKRTSGDIISDNAVVDILHTKAAIGGIGGDLGGDHGIEFAEFIDTPINCPVTRSIGAPGGSFSVGRDRMGLGGNGAYGGNGGYGGDDANYTDSGGKGAKVNGFTSTPGSGHATANGSLTGADKVIDHTAINEGRGKYDAWTANDNGHGVSYGLVQFNQDVGSLPTLMKKMNESNPELFEHYFGAQTPNMLDEHFVRTANLNDPDIKERMLEAARDPEFQQVQRDVAKEGYFDFIPEQSQKYMGVATPSERSVAMLFDSNIQNGPQGTSNLLKEAARAGGTEREIMLRFAGMADATRYSNNRRTNCFNDPSFSDDPFHL